MNKNLLVFALALSLFSCNSQENHGDHDHGNSEHNEHKEHHDEHGHQHGEEAEHHDENEVHLSARQAKVLGLKIGTAEYRNISATISATGRLEVPPQNEASISSFIQGSVTNIKIIEGDKVKKGQLLAYVSDPKIVDLQADYQEALSQLKFLETEYQRQRALLEKKATSGRESQRITSEYQSLRAKVAGLKAKLELIRISPSRVESGKIDSKAPIYSPIEGYIKKVEVNTGQYIQPGQHLFDVVNNHHIHADLMVFEQDAPKVKIGQKVRFQTNASRQEYVASIYSVGKVFEEESKAVHIHAEIVNNSEELLSGTFIEGRIEIAEDSVLAVPQEAIVEQGDTYFIFVLEKKSDAEFHFKPLKVVLAQKDQGWVAINPLEEFPDSSKITLNNAYQLLAEMKKSEAGHGHHH